MMVLLQMKIMVENKNRLSQAISVISSRIIIISQWNEASHEIMGIQNE